MADGYDNIIVHLNQRDVTMVTISRAPLEKLLAFQKRMGWHFKWLSSANNDFNFDYHYLDLVPKGQDEDGRDMFWLRHHDKYENGAKAHCH